MDDLSIAQILNSSRNRSIDDDQEDMSGGDGEVYVRGEHSGDEHDYDRMDNSGMILEQDRFLPIANIARIMKKMIPESGKIAKDAKECMQECISEFISFITSEASERCLLEKRKTINGEDLLNALQTLGFDQYVEPLKTYILRYRDANRLDKNTAASMLVNPGIATSMLVNPGIATSMLVNPGIATTSSGITAIVTQTTSDCKPTANLSSNQSSDGSPSRLTTVPMPQMQMLLDPETGQHYVCVQTANGTQQLLPVQLATAAGGAVDGQQSMLLTTGVTHSATQFVPETS